MPHRPFCEQDLLFFGATTASVSHELKNVITIINESAGLLHDFASAAERGRPLDPQRVKKTSLDISRNVERAVEIINRLNRFAHSADEPVRAVDLNGMVRDVVALASRFAGLRGRQIDAVVPGSAVTVSAYAFGLHQVLFRALSLAAEALPAADPIRLDLEPTSGGAILRISRVPIDLPEQARARWGELVASARELGVNVVRSGEERDGAIELVVPSAAP
jgi:signal transduction histidine kinase